MSLLLFRLIAASITRLAYIHHFIKTGMDLSFDSIPYSITTQIHSTFSIIVACSSALKPFMDSVQTGMLSVSLAKHGPGTTFGHDSYNLRTLSNSGEDSSHTSSRQQHRPASGHHSNTTYGSSPGREPRSRSRSRSVTKEVRPRLRSQSPRPRPRAGAPPRVLAGK